MAVGLSAVNLANAWLNVLRGGGNGVTFTAPATIFVELHIGDPGAAGTSNPSAVTTRQALTFAAASAGSMAQSSTPAFSMTTTETITHIALWSASSAGTFYTSIALSVSKAVVNTDTLTLSTCSIALTPIAA